LYINAVADVCFQRDDDKEYAVDKDNLKQIWSSTMCIWWSS